MGSYVSIPYCQAEYNITVDCSIRYENGTRIDSFDGNWPEGVQLGGVSKGEFQGDSDIAGVGILGVFIAVTSFALAVSIVDVLWQVSKVCGKRRSRRRESKKDEIAKTTRRVSVSDILETLVLACSDQQVFTGAAYAITLRYYTGCSVSAYHYNIVANMLLLTCATHLVSVIIVRNYWRYSLLAAIRILSITGVFIVTGLLFTNQNAESRRFPTGVPKANETDSLLFLAAACFESSDNAAIHTFHNTTKNPNAFFDNTLVQSKPDNKVQGWNYFVITLLYYGAAIIVAAVRYVRRGKSRPGWRGRLGQTVGRSCGDIGFLRKGFEFVFLLYLLVGVFIGGLVVVMAGRYIFNLRTWVDHSGWIAKENGKLNPENDWSTFGQLVPIITSALIVFSFLQVLSGRLSHVSSTFLTMLVASQAADIRRLAEKITKNRNRAHKDEETPPQDGTIEYLDPSNYNLITPAAKLPEKSTEYFGAAAGRTPNMHKSDTPPRVDLEHQSSFGSSMSIPNASPLAVEPSSPMLISSVTPASPATPKRTKTPAVSPRPDVGLGYSAVPTDPEPAIVSRPPSLSGSLHPSRVSLPPSPDPEAETERIDSKTSKPT
ncbi:hypothetical protein F5Y18DRAFT_422625 [Xylariaceae sp. FL1019]|nr:hypothetical protein F5Y18DRAFT_422625 [Xylariaceae sp. FL1019]